MQSLFVVLARFTTSFLYQSQLWEDWIIKMNKNSICQLINILSTNWFQIILSDYFRNGSLKSNKVEGICHNQC